MVRVRRRFAAAAWKPAAREVARRPKVALSLVRTRRFLRRTARASQTAACGRSSRRFLIERRGFAWRNTRPYRREAVCRAGPREGAWDIQRGADAAAGGDCGGMGSRRRERLLREREAIARSADHR